MVDRGKKKKGVESGTDKLDAVLGKTPDISETRFPHRKSNDYMSMFIFLCGIGFIFS